MTALIFSDIFLIFYKKQWLFCFIYVIIKFIASSYDVNIKNIRSLENACLS